MRVLWQVPRWSSPAHPLIPSQEPAAMFQTVQQANCALYGVPPVCCNLFDCILQRMRLRHSSTIITRAWADGPRLPPQRCTRAHKQRAPHRYENPGLSIFDRLLCIRNSASCLPARCHGLTAPVTAAGYPHLQRRSSPPTAHGAGAGLFGRLLPQHRRARHAHHPPGRHARPPAPGAEASAG